MGGVESTPTPIFIRDNNGKVSLKNSFGKTTVVYSGIYFMKIELKHVAKSVFVFISSLILVLKREGELNLPPTLFYPWKQWKSNYALCRYFYLSGSFKNIGIFT